MAELVAVANIAETHAIKSLKIPGDSIAQPQRKTAEAPCGHPSEGPAESIEETHLTGYLCRLFGQKRFLQGFAANSAELEILRRRPPAISYATHRPSTESTLIPRALAARESNELMVSIDLRPCKHYTPRTRFRLCFAVVRPSQHSAGTLLTHRIAIGTSSRSMTHPRVTSLIGMYREPAL